MDPLTTPELELLIDLLSDYMDRDITQREWADCKVLSEKLDVMLDAIP